MIHIADFFSLTELQFTSATLYRWACTSRSHFLTLLKKWDPDVRPVKVWFKFGRNCSWGHRSDGTVLLFLHNSSSDSSASFQKGGWNGTMLPSTRQVHGPPAVHLGSTSSAWWGLIRTWTRGKRASSARPRCGMSSYPSIIAATWSRVSALSTTGQNLSILPFCCGLYGSLKTWPMPWRQRNLWNFPLNSVPLSVQTQYDLTSGVSAKMDFSTSRVDRADLSGTKPQPMIRREASSITAMSHSLVLEYWCKSVCQIRLTWPAS